VHANSGNFVLIISLHSTNRNHITLTPNLTLTFSKLPKTAHIPISATDHHHPLIHLSEHYHQHLAIMKFKTDIPVSDKNTSDQHLTDSSAPKIVEPLTIVPPTKPKKKTTSKSTSRKKKNVKRGESKVALSMSDMYEKENPFKASEEGTTAQVSKNVEEEDASKIASDVAIPVCEKGNPNLTLISDEPVSGRKLGLEDLNDAIESTENMDVDNPDNETRVDDSVDSDPKETDAQDNVGPDVGTSLGQPDSPNGDADVVTDVSGLYIG